MRITDKIHQLRIGFNITLSPEVILPRFVHVLIVFDDVITLIDSGVKGSESLIFKYIEQQNRSVNEIRNLILTHAHPDHIGSAANIKKQTECDVYAHEKERNWIENIQLQEKERPVPGFRSLVDSPVLVDVPISGNFFTLKPNSTLGLELIHTPGHSPGMLSIRFPEDKVLFTADAIPLMNDIPNYDNMNELLSSLGKINRYVTDHALLSSWTNPCTTTNEAKKLLTSGNEYINQIHRTVMASYRQEEVRPLDNCRKTIAQLGLPPFLVTSVVDNAFRSHLNYTE